MYRHISQKLNNVVVAYSYEHFDPETRVSKGSAGSIAARVYEAITEFPDFVITYIDSNHPESWPPLKDVELLVTRDVYVPALIYIYRPKKTLIVEVNQARPARLAKMELVSKFCAREIKSIRKSSNFLCNKHSYLIVGNSVTESTFNKVGIFSINMRQVGYGLDSTTSHIDYMNGKNLIICHIGEISFRKGIDFIAKLVAFSDQNSLNLIFAITGLPPSGFESNAIFEELAKYGNVVTLGWIDVNSIEFQSVKSQARAAIFPTREEGLAGSYLDISTSGIPTFTTKEVGVEVPELLTLKSLDQNEAESVMQKILQNERELWNAALVHRKYLLGLKNSEISIVIRNLINSNSITPKVVFNCKLDKRSKRVIKRLFADVDKKLELNEDYFLFNSHLPNLSTDSVIRLRHHIQLASRMNFKSIIIKDLGTISHFSDGVSLGNTIIDCDNLGEHNCFINSKEVNVTLLHWIKGKSGNIESYFTSLKVVVKWYLMNIKNLRANFTKRPKAPNIQV